MVSIDKEKCIGCGTCSAVAPKLFRMKCDKAEVIKQPKTEDEKKLAKEASESCPVNAIST